MQITAPLSLRGLAGGIVAVTALIPVGKDHEALRRRDADYRHGVIEYRFMSPPQDAEGKGPELDYRGKLVFSSDGSMLERLEKPRHLGEKVKYAVFVKSKGWQYTEIADEDSVEVTFIEGEDWVRNEDPRTMLQAIPCGPLGLGLGKAAGVEESAGDPVRYSGALSDGLTFRISLASQGVPVQLDYLNGDKLFGRWTYSGALETASPLRLPEKAEFKAPWLGTRGDRRFEFLKANLGTEPKPEALVTEWLRPEATINDRRLNPPVVWTYRDLVRANGGSPKLTPGRLLELSKARNE